MDVQNSFDYSVRLSSFSMIFLKIFTHFEPSFPYKNYEYMLYEYLNDFSFIIEKKC